MSSCVADRLHRVTAEALCIERVRTAGAAKTPCSARFPSFCDAVAAVRSRYAGCKPLRPMNWSKLSKQVIKGAVSAWSDLDIPFLAPKKSSVVPFVLGAVGVAFVGGIAAVMVMSPRTRYRALDIAKGGYGAVKGQIGKVGIGGSAETGASHQGYSNGLSGEGGAGYSSTGL